MKIKYFAWLKERIGKAEEEITLPLNVITIADLIDFLIGKDEAYAYAFEKKELIRAAINQKHVKPTATLDGAVEVAFFPPMTGG
jgi:sulfur-carrier protein